MILHCVFCSFRKEVTPQQRTDIFEKLSAFSLGLDGVMAFDFGPNRDFEKKSPDHSDGFVIRFQSRQALDAYAVHPVHKVLGGSLCDLCQGGADGLIVFDIETT